LVIAQIILLSWWFSKKPSKKTNQKNGHVTIDLSKMAFWSSWTWGQKNRMGVFFFPKIHAKKNHDFL